MDLERLFYSGNLELNQLWTISFLFQGSFIFKKKHPKMIFIDSRPSLSYEILETTKGCFHGFGNKSISSLCWHIKFRFLGNSLCLGFWFEKVWTLLKPIAYQLPYPIPSRIQYPIPNQIPYHTQSHNKRTPNCPIGSLSGPLAVMLWRLIENRRGPADRYDKSDCPLRPSDWERTLDTDGQKWTHFDSGGSLGGI